MEHPVVGDPGVVDENIDRAEVLADLRQSGHALFVFRHAPLVGVNAGLHLEFGGGFIVGVVGRRYLAPSRL